MDNLLFKDAISPVDIQRPPLAEKVTTSRFCKNCQSTTRHSTHKFTKNNKPRVRLVCRPCDNKTRSSIRREQRTIVLNHYGPNCACCDESTYEFLALDHINGGGNLHRRSIRKGHHPGGSGMYQWVIRNGFPLGFRILCHNCNSSRGAYGYCPHEKT
jgi:hypothetical protein